ncbi:MAG: hypothetical protein DDT21_02078 [Syntrophomonadaceae bacterium]|nr:hypothetical protein [Bacillota bacterium]
MMTEKPETLSPEGLKEGLGRHGYICDDNIATVLFMAEKLAKPLLIEGPAGVGKTELARAYSDFKDRRLIRLQCYEGLDETKAIYEWNYKKQLLYIQAEKENSNWQDIEGDIFTKQFLLARPLLDSITSPEPAVLLVDELDKVDQEFEAMLLELLGDWQITIPEIGTIRARHAPAVFLTSNRSREISEALKRRCLYLYSVVDSKTILTAMQSKCRSAQNIRRDGKVMLTVCAEGDVAAGIKGKATMVCEMTAFRGGAIFQIDVLEVKDDSAIDVEVVSGVVMKLRSPKWKKIIDAASAELDAAAGVEKQERVLE